MLVVENELPAKKFEFIVLWNVYNILTMNLFMMKISAPTRIV